MTGIMLAGNLMRQFDYFCLDYRGGFQFLMDKASDALGNFSDE